MCSRFCLTAAPLAVQQLFAFKDGHDFPPRYNIAPTQPVAIVRNGLSGERELALVRWGLIPSWTKEPEKFSTLINARAETAGEKPSFRGAMRHRRCLIPATGFYEWTGRAGHKKPHLISQSQGVAGGGSHPGIAAAADDLPLMAFAGLWDHWLGADGSEIETMAILTVPANADVAPIHDRMPLILEPSMFEGWLDCSSGLVDGVLPFMTTPPDGLLQTRPISRRLNNARNDGPGVHAPADLDEPQGTLL